MSSVTARNITASDDYSAAGTFVSSSASRGSISGGTYTLGELAPGATASFYVTTTSTSYDAILTNTAAVRGRDASAIVDVIDGGGGGQSLTLVNQQAKNGQFTKYGVFAPFKIGKAPDVDVPVFKHYGIYHTGEGTYYYSYDYNSQFSAVTKSTDKDKDTTTASFHYDRSQEYDYLGYFGDKEKINLSVAATGDSKYKSKHTGSGMWHGPNQWSGYRPSRGWGYVGSQTYYYTESSGRDRDISEQLDGNPSQTITRDLVSGGPSNGYLFVSGLNTDIRYTGTWSYGYDWTATGTMDVWLSDPDSWSGWGIISGGTDPINDMRSGPPPPDNAGTENGKFPFGGTNTSGWNSGVYAWNYLYATPDTVDFKVGTGDHKVPYTQTGTKATKKADDSKQAGGIYSDWLTNSTNAGRWDSSTQIHVDVKIKDWTEYANKFPNEEMMTQLSANFGTKSWASANLATIYSNVSVNNAAWQAWAYGSRATLKILVPHLPTGKKLKLYTETRLQIEYVTANEDGQYSSGESKVLTQVLEETNPDTGAAYEWDYKFSGQTVEADYRADAVMGSGSMLGVSYTVGAWSGNKFCTGVRETKVPRIKIVNQ